MENLRHNMQALNYKTRMLVRCWVWIIQWQFGGCTTAPGEVRVLISFHAQVQIISISFFLLANVILICRHLTQSNLETLTVRKQTLAPGCLKSYRFFQMIEYGKYIVIFTNTSQCFNTPTVVFTFWGGLGWVCNRDGITLNTVVFYRVGNLSVKANGRALAM